MSRLCVEQKNENNIKSPCVSAMKAKSRRRAVIFPAPFHHNKSLQQLQRKQSRRMDAETLTEALDASHLSDGEAAEATVEELPASANVVHINHDPPPVPALFTTPPPIRDDLITKSSTDQDETMEQCLPYLAGTADPDKTLFDFSPAGVPRLEREEHVQFLRAAVQNARYIPYDAQRPWCVYWALTGLSLLGQDVSEYQQR